MVAYAGEQRANPPSLEPDHGQSTQETGLGLFGVELDPDIRELLRLSRTIAELSAKSQTSESIEKTLQFGGVPVATR